MALIVLKADVDREVPHSYGDCTVWTGYCILQLQGKKP